MQYWNQILNLLQKDLKSEFRAKEAVIAMLLFGIMIIVIFSFAFTMGIQEQKDIAPGLLWVAFTFAGILGLNHSFYSEMDNNCLQGILLTPVPRSVIYIGKFFSNLVFMLVAEILVLVVFLWLFDVRFTDRWHYLALTLFLGTSAFAATGTIFSAVSSGIRMRVFLLPILQFPVSIPAIISAVQATSALLKEEELLAFYDWINLLVVFNIIFITVSVLLFEYILEE